MHDTLETLKVFEKECMSIFVARETAKKQQSMEYRLTQLEEK